MSIGYPAFVEYILILVTSFTLLTSLILSEGRNEPTLGGIGQYNVLGMISLFSHVNEEVRGRATSSRSGIGLPN